MIPKMRTEMSEQPVYGAAEVTKPRTETRFKVRTHHLQQWKNEGHKWAMLTAYDYSSARVFDDAGIPVLLVGDSAANVVYGYDTTVPISIDELIPLVRGVVRGAPHALVVADLPFGSYEAGAAQALSTAVRFMKEAGAHAVKLRGRRAGRRADRGAHPGRHPGRRAHRFHAAVGQQPGRFPGAGPR